MQTILVTGAAGFIGSKTCELLLGSGYNVVGLDNMNDYYDTRLKDYRVKNLKRFSNFMFNEGDIENLPGLELIFSNQRFDSIINLAARAGVRYSLEYPEVYITTNVMGTLNLLDLMKKYQINKMVIASTSSLYAGQDTPFVESLPVNTPISPYAASKKAAEVMAYTYYYLYGLDITVVRYFTVYGPAGRPAMSPFRFIKWIDEGTPVQLYGDGSQARDFTYVDDIAEGTIKALKKVGYEIINLGGGKNPVSLNLLIEKMEEQLGKKAVIAYGEVRKTDMQETWADIGKAKQILDWEPKISLDQGIQKTIDWYMQNKDWIKDLKM